jgi:hypothetical protein
VAYEPGHPGIPIHLDLTPQSPLSPSSPTLSRPDRLFLRSSGLSRFTVWSSLRTTGTSLLDPEMGSYPVSRNSIVDSVPDLPTIHKAPASPRTPFRVSANPSLAPSVVACRVPASPFRASADPAMSPGFVACRECSQYHKHGFSHAEERNSGSGAWWRSSGVRNKWKRRESQSTFFISEDESSVASPPTSP